MRARLPRQRLEEYDKWCAKGAPFAAACALGKGLYEVADDEREGFLAELKQRVEPGILAEAATHAVGSWHRAVRIVSIGSKWNEDELLLVVGLRMQIQFAVSLLREFAVDVTAIDLAPIDSELRAIAASPENRRAFKSAIATLMSNADYEVNDLWSKP